MKQITIPIEDLLEDFRAKETAGKFDELTPDELKDEAVRIDTILTERFDAHFDLFFGLTNQDFDTMDESVNADDAKEDLRKAYRLTRYLNADLNKIPKEEEARDVVLRHIPTDKGMMPVTKTVRRPKEFVPPSKLKPNMNRFTYQVDNATVSTLKNLIMKSFDKGKDRARGQEGPPKIVTGTWWRLHYEALIRAVDADQKKEAKT